MAAGTTVARINTIVTANTTQFTAAMGKAQTTAGKFAAAAKTAARAASGPLTLGILGAGAAAVKAAVDFDDSMTKIESLVGIAGSEVDAMAESVRALSGETAQAPAALADAMFFIQSAGLRGAVAMETLDAAAKAAAVGLGEVTEIADLATSALNAYGSENLSAIEATDVLTAAVREGKLEASELAGSMGRVLPIASAMGVQFNEVGAAFAALSRTGTNAAEAATQVRGILSSLLRPTKQAEEALAGMGLSSEGLRRQLREEGLLATLKTLAEEFDGNAAAAASVFGNIRALSGVMDLMGANTATTEQIFANMEDTTGTLNEAFDVVSDTAGFKFRQALAEVQETLVTLGDRVLPVVLEMVEGFRSMIGAVTALPGPILAVGAALTAITVLSGPLGIVVAAIGGLAYALGLANDDAKRAAELQATLTDEFVKAGDPTIHLADRIRDLASAMDEVGKESGDVAPEIDGIIGEATVFSQLLANDMLPVLDALGMDLETFTEILQQGEEAFDGTGGMAHQLTNMLYANRDAYQDLYKDTEKVVDLSRDLAIAFDGVTETTEANNQAVLDDGTAYEALTAAGLDAKQMLTDLDASGKTATQQLIEIEDAIALATHQANLFTHGFDEAGVALGETGPALEEAEEATGEVAAAMGEAADETFRMRDEFSKLMEAILGEGNALKAATDLAEELAETAAQIGEKNAPDMADAFERGGSDIGAVLDEIREKYGSLDDPEAMAAVGSAFDSLVKIGEAAGRDKEEIDNLRRVLAALDGFNAEVQLRFLAALISDPAGTSASLSGFGPGTIGGGDGGFQELSGFGPGPIGGGDNTTIVNVNMPVGSDAADIIRSLDDYKRRNGNVPITTGG